MDLNHSFINANVMVTSQHSFTLIALKWLTCSDDKPLYQMTPLESFDELL